LASIAQAKVVKERKARQALERLVRVRHLAQGARARRVKVQPHLVLAGPLPLVPLPVKVLQEPVAPAQGLLAQEVRVALQVLAEQLEQVRQELAARPQVRVLREPEQALEVPQPVEPQQERVLVLQVEPPRAERQLLPEVLQQAGEPPQQAPQLVLVSPQQPASKLAVLALLLAQLLSLVHWPLHLLTSIAKVLLDSVL
jgi:hypothetical protein